MIEHKTTTVSRGFLSGLLITTDQAHWTSSAILHMIKEIITRAEYLNKPGWASDARKLFAWIKTPLVNMAGAPFGMFQKGNGKLPFWTWSSLPGVNCPGAGACLLIDKIKNRFLGWCYSLKAWRYPAAFMRQLQNTILELPAYRPLIVNELRRIYETKANQGRVIPLRLYVDGDFKTLNALRFWMDTLKKFPRIQAYGYSKSLHLFMELDQTGYEWPKNYALNLSSGGKYSTGPVAEYVKTLPIYRGEFVAVMVSRETERAWSKQEMTRDHTREIREKFAGEKVFICPKYCGDCTLMKDNPHACGNRDKFKDIKIVIPIH